MTEVEAMLLDLRLRISQVEVLPLATTAPRGHTMHAPLWKKRRAPTTAQSGMQPSGTGAKANVRFGEERSLPACLHTPLFGPTSTLHSASSPPRC